MTNIQLSLPYWLCTAVLLFSLFPALFSLYLYTTPFPQFFFSFQHLNSFSLNRNMFSATLKSVRTQPSLFVINPAKSCEKLGRKSNTATVRFQQVAAGVHPPEPEHNMDNKMKKPEEVNQKGDVMSHSFGEGYATRSDEEGFGGVYGGNQSLSKGDDDKIVHGNSPDYDKSQGSEVKEKEKARHQTDASS